MNNEPLEPRDERTFAIIRKNVDQMREKFQKRVEAARNQHSERI